ADTRGNGRIDRRNLPPITQLLHANQEILVQVLRAPMGTKGARITTRLSLPGRYTVLMLNSGSYVGVSRKIEDPRERTRLRALAARLRPDGCSLIVRTEAEGKSDEELEGDIRLLVDLKDRIDAKAAGAPAPSLIHGDLTLIFRLIRDAFTRDVGRVVVDAPSVYENVLELVDMIAPGMKHRVFLYDEALPIFHAYNIEPEIERLLKRRVWLPSGGYLVVDQAEALTAIDVNTGRFVGSTELAETVLTTNLQAAEEVARQLRVRDLGGIIVVDFIDMDNPRHRQQVMRAFEDALRRDRAKIKVHSISPLGLVEMTRKRTGDSMGRLLTEPCPYCSGIGRVQNPLTMALRIERELAAQSVVHAETEAFLVYAHPRVVASMLGYEGEAHRDLEQYVGRPIYFRLEEEYHPNTYRMDRLTLEQALAAVPHLEEEETVEARVVNPDPELSLDPLVCTKGIFVVVPGLDAPVGAKVKVKITDTGTSLAFAAPLAEELRAVRADALPAPRQRPPLVPESVLPTYLREELAQLPPDGMSLLSPTSFAVETPEEAEAETDRRGRRRKTRRESRIVEIPLTQPGVTPDAEAMAPLAAEVVTEAEAEPDAADAARHKRRRRGGRGRGTRGETAAEELVAKPLLEGERPLEPPLEGESPLEPQLEGETPVESDAAPAKSRRRRRGGRRRSRSERQPTEPVALAPQFEEIPPDVAAEALMTMISVIGGEETPPTGEPPLAGERPPEPPLEGETPVEPAPKPRRRAPRRTTKAAEPAAQLTLEGETPAEPPPAPDKPARTPRAPRKPRAKKTDTPPEEPAEA
ncbi:MAG TPA: Rne/Rng family ribonuclease, partial [Armatimonadota bacterium]|nr:Rne/Rng family ribonuclease [Armatimonadota bacterium]